MCICFKIFQIRIPIIFILLLTTTVFSCSIDAFNGEISGSIDGNLTGNLDAEGSANIQAAADVDNKVEVDANANINNTAEVNIDTNVNSEVEIDSEIENNVNVDTDIDGEFENNGDVNMPTGEIETNYSSLNFGIIEVGDLHTERVSIFNNGLATLLVSNIIVDGIDMDEFSVNITSVSLNPGSSKDVEITFSAIKGGIKSATMSIYSNDADDEIVTIPLSAEVLIPTQIDEEEEERPVEL